MNAITEAQANRVLSLANVHALAGSSSDVCWVDADAQFAAGNFEASARWSLKSLAHSVGIFAGPYRVAAGIAPECDPFGVPAWDGGREHHPKCAVRKVRRDGTCSWCEMDGAR